MKSHNQAAARRGLAAWRETLAASDASRTVIAHLEAHLADVAERMLNESRTEVPQLANAPKVISDRLRRHCELHVHAMLRIMKLGFDLERADFGFVRDNAVTRCREGYPLAALLHAYRAGHRATWSAMSELLGAPDGSLGPEDTRGLLALSVFAMEYTNHVSNVAAAAYSDEARHRERVTSRARAELLDALLTSDHDATIARRARDFGLKPAADFVVFAVRTDRSDEEQGEEWLTNCGRNLERLIEAHCAELLIDVRRREVVGVASARPGFDRDLERLLRDTVHKWASAPALRVGISPVRPGLESVPVSYQDCQHALAHAGDERPVVCFRDLSVFDHLVATADVSTYRIRPPWFDTLMAEDARMNGALLKTLRAYVDSRLSTKAAAATLRVHVNTVYHRLRKFETITSGSAQHVPVLIDAITLLSLHRLSGERHHPEA